MADLSWLWLACCIAGMESDGSLLVSDGFSGVEQPAWIYVGDTAHRRPATSECPIWLSYVDCVLAGYFELGGAAAVDAFITSTTGWDAPLRDDRGAPLYSRAVKLNDQQKQKL